jgi:hypothetical protein
VRRQRDDLPGARCRHGADDRAAATPGSAWAASATNCTRARHQPALHLDGSAAARRARRRRVSSSGGRWRHAGADGRVDQCCARRAVAHVARRRQCATPVSDRERGPARRIRAVSLRRRAPGRG